LIRVWHYRRVEEGSRFQRILGEEIRADQEASLFGKLRIGQQHFANLLEAFLKTPVNLLMSLGELCGDLFQEDADGFLRQCHDSGDYPGHPLRVPRAEWP
jgi:hypothetical protein